MAWHSNRGTEISAAWLPWGRPTQTHCDMEGRVYARHAQSRLSPERLVMAKIAPFHHPKAASTDAVDQFQVPGGAIWRYRVPQT